jgi:hypothetical protein
MFRKNTDGSSFLVVKNHRRDTFDFVPKVYELSLTVRGRCASRAGDNIHRRVADRTFNRSSIRRHHGELEHHQRRVIANGMATRERHTSSSRKGHPDQLARATVGELGRTDGELDCREMCLTVAIMAKTITATSTPANAENR